MPLYFPKPLELTVCWIIKINNKVYMSVKIMPNKLHLTVAKSCMLSKLYLGLRQILFITLLYHRIQ